VIGNYSDLTKFWHTPLIVDLSFKIFFSLDPYLFLWSDLKIFCPVGLISKFLWSKICLQLLLSVVLLFFVQNFLFMLYWAFRGLYFAPSSLKTLFRVLFWVSPTFFLFQQLLRITIASKTAFFFEIVEYSSYIPLSRIFSFSSFLISSDLFKIHLQSSSLYLSFFESLLLPDFKPWGAWTSRFISIWDDLTLSILDSEGPSHSWLHLVQDMTQRAPHHLQMFFLFFLLLLKLKLSFSPRFWLGVEILFLSFIHHSRFRWVGP